MSRPAAAAVDLARFEEASYFVANGFHLPFLADLARQVPAPELAGLAALSFVLLKPDAVLAGKVRQALGVLAEAGLVIVDAAVCLGAHPRAFEELYKFNLTRYNEQNMVGAWWLNRQVYELGPVVALLLAAPGGESGEGQRRIAAVKGPSSPYRCEPWQLRARLGATNRSINLVHAADGPLSTAREYLLFQPVGRLRAALRWAIAGAGEADQGSDALERELATLPGGALETDFLRVLEGVKARLRKALGERGELAATPALAAAWSESAAAAASGGGLLERTRRYRLASGAERRALAMGASPPGALGAALGELADFDALGLDVAQRAVAALRASGLYLSDWERLVLETSMYYLDDFLAFEPPAARGTSAGVRTPDRAPALAP